MGGAVGGAVLGNVNAAVCHLFCCMSFVKRSNTFL